MLAMQVEKEISSTLTISMTLIKIDVLKKSEESLSDAKKAYTMKMMMTLMKHQGD